MRNLSNALQRMLQIMLRNPTIAAEFGKLSASFPDQACLFRCICHLGGIDAKNDQLVVALLAQQLGLIDATFFVDHAKICTFISLISGNEIQYKGKEVPEVVTPELSERLRIVDHWVFQDPCGHFVCKDYDPKPGSNAVTRGKVVGHRVYEVTRG